MNLAYIRLSYQANWNLQNGSNIGLSRFQKQEHAQGQIAPSYKMLKPAAQAEKFHISRFRKIV